MSIAAVLTRLRTGEKLHQQIVDGHRQWWFDEPFQDVPDAVVVKIRAGGEFKLKEAGDSLFGLPENSQTWGVGVSERTACQVPFCRRTKRALPDLITVDRGAYADGDTVTTDIAEEWLCTDHWRAVPGATRRLHAAAKRKAKRVKTLASLLVFLRVWRRAKRQAVEGTAGI